MLPKAVVLPKRARLLTRAAVGTTRGADMRRAAGVGGGAGGGAGGKRHLYLPAHDGLNQLEHGVAQHTELFGDTVAHRARDRGASGASVALERRRRGGVWSVSEWG